MAEHPTSTQYVNVFPFITIKTIHTFKFSLQYLIKNTTLLLDFSVLKVMPGQGKRIGLSVRVIIRQYTSGMVILCYQ